MKQPICLQCNKEFKGWQGNPNKFCSKICNSKFNWADPVYRQHMSAVHKGQISPMKGKHQTEESKLKMSLSKKGIPSTLKGISWGKHTEETKNFISEIKKGITPLNVLRGDFKGEKNWQWKGDEVSYRSLHKWVERQLGKPRCCEDCGDKSLSHRQYHWANLSGNYKRITTDWRRLCCKCHKAYDKQMKLQKLNQEYN
jgi:hypothetical protein